MKEISAPAATVTGPWLLQAQAKVVSASRNRNPPWAMPCPFTIRSVTRIRATACPSRAFTTSMPREAEAVSASSMVRVASAMSGSECDTAAHRLAY